LTNPASFAKEILVSCPHYKKETNILSEYGHGIVPYPFQTKSKFRCNNCFKPIEEKSWHDPLIIFSFGGKWANCRTSFSNIERFVKRYQSK
jgi:hypothetical protein